MHDLIRCLKAAAEAFALEAGRIVGDTAPAVTYAPPPAELAQIACPFCDAAVEKTPGQNSWFRCKRGHSFDRAAPAAPAIEV